MSLMVCEHSSQAFSLRGYTYHSRFREQKRAALRQSAKRHIRSKRRGATASVQDIIGVLVFSALPFAAVQALAESELGKKLQSDLRNRKGALEREQQQKASQCAAARADSPWYGEQRPKWLGPLPYSYPGHLRGDAPGDYGYDVASLGADPAAFDRNFELELLHGRWAMLAGLGILIPEVLQYTGVTQFSEARWWNVGYAKLQGEDLNYLGISGLRIAGSQGVLIIAVCQVLLMFGPEYARSCGINALEPLGLYFPGDKNYPGGIFDPLGAARDPAQFEDLKVKEMKNGRLAMVAWLGFFAQAAVTQGGPVQNLVDFVKDPVHNNILAYLHVQ